MTWLSEYGSVAYLVERPTLETQAEQYSDTVLFFPSPRILNREKIRNQEKEVLAKGVSEESSVTPKETKMHGGIGPSSTFGTQSATAKRGVYFCKTPLLETPFSWHLKKKPSFFGGFPCFSFLRIVFLSPQNWSRLKPY